MKPFRWLLLLGLVLTAVAARAAEVVPLPNFANHAIPQTQNPAPRADALEWLDLAALATGLTVASLLALRWRSRRGLVALAVVSLAWLGFWRQGCICPIGAIQNMTQAAFDPTCAVPLVAVGFFVLPLVFTLFFGRTFCAAVCPMGAMQELAAVRPLRVPTWLDQSLGLLPYVYLGAAVLLAATGGGFLICRYDPFVGMFRMSGSTDMLLWGGGLLLIGLVIGRPYCRYLCPLGAVLGMLSKVSRWHVRIPPKDCIRCRLCEDSCPYGAIREPTVDQPAHARPASRRRLAAMLALAPLLVAVGAWLGTRLDVPLARMHPTVDLAEQLGREARAERDGTPIETTEASRAFRNTGRKVDDLFADARAIRGRFAWAGGLFGAWVGLVVGVKLVYLSVRRRRNEYLPDRASCVACGRCFWYCPNEQARLGLIQEGLITVNP